MKYPPHNAHHCNTTGARRLAALSVLGVVALSACSSGSKQAAEVPAATPSAPLTADYSAVIASSLEGVPSTTATVPDGTYRVSLRQSDLIALKESDLSNSGTWTFTVKAGSYTLECSPVANPNTDCGNVHAAKYPATVEIGPLRGSGNTMWLVHDVLKSKEVIHCDPLLGESEGGCGPLAPYSLTWTKTKDGLRFADTVANGVHSGPASWWAKAYTKIG